MVGFFQGAVNDGAVFCAVEKFQNLTASWTKATSWSLRYLEVSIIVNVCNNRHLA